MSLTVDAPALHPKSRPSDDRVVQYKLQHFKVSRARRKIGQPNQIYVSEVICPEQPWEKFTYVKPTNTAELSSRITTMLFRSMPTRSFGSMIPKEI